MLANFLKSILTSKSVRKAGRWGCVLLAAALTTPCVCGAIFWSLINSAP